MSGTTLETKKGQKNLQDHQDGFLFLLKDLVFGILYQAPIWVKTISCYTFNALNQDCIYARVYVYINQVHRQLDGQADIQAVANEAELTGRGIGPEAHGRCVHTLQGPDVLLLSWSN